MKDQSWRPSDETLKSVVGGVFKTAGLTLAVIVGTALGNGVPMARSVSAGFETGFRTGLSKCPCANKRPATTTAANLKPEAVALPAASSPTPIVLTGEVGDTVQTSPATKIVVKEVETK